MAEFEAYDSISNRRLRVTYDDVNNKFLFYVDGTWTEYTHWCSDYSGDRWALAGNNHYTLHTTWKNEDQRNKIRWLVEYQWRRFRVDAIEKDMAKLQRDLDGANHDVQEASCRLYDRPILFVLCLSACMPRLKRGIWLPVDLIRLLVTYL